MRWMMAVGVSLTVLAGSGWADEIYRWTDAAGNVHFSNTPTSGGTPTVLNDEQPLGMAAPEAGGEGVAAAAIPAAAEDTGFSTDASLRRNAIERESRAAERRLRQIDDQLASLGRARSARSGDPATGGVVLLGGDVRSDEERSLEREREELAKRNETLQSDYAKLREEVSARLGGVPPWWVDLKTSHR
jgi:hypothetical protein